MITRAKYFMIDIYVKRDIIYELAKRDFQRQYMGSYLGFLWVFLQPLIFIAILYVVFTFGFRAGPVTDMPFAVYLITGIIAWLYFSDILNVTSGVISSHAYLVNKVDFRLSILPIVKILSALVPHIFFILIAIVIAWFHGYVPTLYTLQVFYYLFCMVALLLGLGWMTSSTSIFVQDIVKVVDIMVQFGFWLTPIFWNISLIPQKYQWIVKLNPIFYIIRGYRDSLVSNISFWSHPFGTLYFWSCTIFLLFCGIAIFGKLRPHFAEVV
jgi:ABC-type polysaccharide/polyol phosphate export permease